MSKRLKLSQAIKEIKNSSKIKKDILNCLTDEKTVVKEIKDAMIMNIMDKVYNAYTPNMYDRRGDIDGLADRNNIEVKPEPSKGIVVSVQNITMANPYTNDGISKNAGKYLTPIIEDGYPSDYGLPSARPFIDETIETLEDGYYGFGDTITDAMKKALKNKGYKVK